MPGESSTWINIGPYAREAQAASKGLGDLFRERLDRIREKYLAELANTPQSHRSDPEVQRSILDEVLGSVRGELEERFLEMDRCLKDEIKARIELERRNRLETMFNRVGQAVLEEWPMANLIGLISEECNGLIGCGFTTIFTGDEIRFEGANAPLKPFVEEVLRTGTACLVDNLSGDPRTTVREPQTGLCPIRNLLACPIVTGETTFGVIVCTDKDGGFTADDGGTLSRVAGRIGLVFYKARIQEEILETKRFYEDLVSKAGRAIVTLRDGKISSWNEVAASIFGFTATEVVGQELDLILSEGAGSHLEDVAETGGIVSFETKGRRRDDAELDVLVTLSRMTDEADLVGIIADLTERKRLQRQVLQSEKLAAVGELIAGVAHELNNPLAAVIGYSELLREQTDLAEAVQEDLGMIHISAERCKEIVEKLLRFARKETTQFLTMSLNQVLRDTVALRQHEMELRNVEIAVEEKASLPALFGNPGQLQQVFLNLLNNAFDAIQETERAGQIRITVDQVEEMAIVEFRDSGPGIPESKLSRIFDPFFTTKQTGRGTGLGLSIAYRIVENHGGYIDVDSEDGKGSTFRVNLPLNIAAALAEAAQETLAGQPA